MLLWKNKKGKKFYGRKRYCTQEEISNAIEHNPTYAKISNEIIDKIVDQVIKNEIWYIAQNQSNTTNLEHWKCKILKF